MPGWGPTGTNPVRQKTCSAQCSALKRSTLVTSYSKCVEVNSIVTSLVYAESSSLRIEEALARRDWGDAQIKDEMAQRLEGNEYNQEHGITMRA